MKHNPHDEIFKREKPTTFSEAFERAKEEAEKDVEVCSINGIVYQASEEKVE